jgi:hypothetical protein
VTCASGAALAGAALAAGTAVRADARGDAAAGSPRGPTDATAISSATVGIATARPRTMDAGTGAGAVERATLTPTRAILYVRPAVEAPFARLIVGIHGVCTPPSFVCGSWARAASAHGLLVCPTGDDVCEASPGGPTWSEPAQEVEADIERSVAVVVERTGARFSRDDAVLYGFSRGGYLAPQIVVRHPGRFRYLVVNEADPTLDPAALRLAGVRAVALFAGEWGQMVEASKRNAERLEAGGVPARLWIMRKVSHWYSDDIDDLMREALAWLVAYDAPQRPPPPRDLAGRP